MKQIYTLILLLLASLGYSQCNDDTFDIPQFTTLGYLNIMCFHDNPAAYDLDLNSTGEAVRSPLLSLTTTGTGAASYNTTTRVLNIPTPKASATYSGTTSGSGTYTVTFPIAYSVAPNIQANIINGTDTQNIRTTSVSTTGFTVLVRNRTDIVGLLPTWANVSGASVDVLVTAK